MQGTGDLRRAQAGAGGVPNNGGTPYPEHTDGSSSRPFEAALSAGGERRLLARGGGSDCQQVAGVGINR